MRRPLLSTTQPIAASKAVPFWQSAGITEFGFALTRYQDNVSAQMIEPGGTMVVNGVNSSLFSAFIHCPSPFNAHNTPQPAS